MKMKTTTILEKIKASGNYSNLQLANLIGTTPNTIRSWYNGKSDPRAIFEIKIREVFKTVTSQQMTQPVKTEEVKGYQLQTHIENTSLKDARLNNRLSHKDIGELLDVHPTLVQKWEIGLRDVNKEHLKNLKSILDFNTIKSKREVLVIDEILEFEFITNEKGERMVNSRDLYKTLEISNNYNYKDWAFNNIVNNSFLEKDSDYSIYIIDGKEDLILTFNTAKRIAMMQKTLKGEAVRRYFLKMEEVANQLIQKSFDSYQIADPTQRAMAWIEEEKIRVEQATQLQLQAPKIDYLEKVLASTDSFPIRDVAKELGISSINLNKKLEKLGVQYKQSNQWFLTAKYQGQGYTNTSTYQFERSNGTIGTAHQTYFTEKGRKFIHDFLSDKLDF